MDNFYPCFLLVLTYSIISDLTKNNVNNINPTKTIPTKKLIFFQNSPGSNRYI